MTEFRKILSKIRRVLKKIVITIFQFATLSLYSIFLNYDIIPGLVAVENGKRILTAKGIVGIIVVFIIFILLAFFNNKSNDDKDTKYKNYKLELLEKLRELTSGLCVSKIVTLTNKIEKIIDGEKPTPIISNPSQQIKSIEDAILEILCGTLSTEKYKFVPNDFSISLVYNFDDNWILESTTDRTNSANDLIANNKSLFYHLLNSKTDYLFYNSKQVAKNQNHYLDSNSDSYDETDNNHILLGSILCKKIFIKGNSKNLIKAMISIATYDKQFVDIPPIEKTKLSKNDKERMETVKINIKEHVIKEFESRLEIELCLKYLEHLYKKGNDKKEEEK